MFVDIPFAAIVTEGIHDARAIAKVLEIKGFQEEKRLDHVPEAFNSMVPKRYPWKGEGNELSWIVTHPSFFKKENSWVVVSNAGGESNLGSNLNNILGVLRKRFVESSLCAVAVIADADKKTLETKCKNISSTITEAFREVDEYSFEDSEENQFVAYGKRVPFFMYIFPNNKDQGTLEGLLIEGGKKTYPELLHKAEEYIAFAKEQSVCHKRLKNYDADKATVGVVANVLRPGRANQVSIHDDNWITLDSLIEVPSHKSFSQFIDNILGTIQHQTNIQK